MKESESVSQSGESFGLWFKVKTVLGGRGAEADPAVKTINKHQL